MFVLSWLAVLAPLVLILVGLVPRANARPRGVAALALGAGLLGLFTALILAGIVAFNGRQVSPTVGFAGGGIGLYLDVLSATMFALVSFVGVAVLRYSRNYLDGDPNHGAFIQRLCLTIAAVQVLTIAGNLALLIAAWIATSLCLNRLLLFYGDRRAAILAARKKFVVSRLGDACLVGAAYCLYQVFGALDYRTIFAGVAAVQGEDGFLTGATLLIAAAALLKSAQFPLHGWILEVMETPTPVSALLHAGIINAGGFLVLRLADVMSLSPLALHVLAVIGGATALFGSLVMLTQTSVKVSLAYSTIAQMGFMLLQCGLGAYAAALLHIVAHSLYKAHAFLSSGSIIDLMRASWSPSPGGSPHPARFLVALMLTLGATFGVSWAFGATLMTKPGVFALGAVLMMGLTLLVANAIDERPNAYVIGRALLSAVVVGALYFALQAGSEYLLADALPSTQPLNTPFDLAIVVAVIVAFATVTWLQSQMGAIGATRLGRVLYVHLSHGLYVNTLANRLALRFWPVRTRSVRAS
jgi:NAD(P)H-quinone oxidoreductase subunit 5